MDQWIKRFAKSSQSKDLTRVFVLVDDAAPDVEVKLPVFGYFALSMSSVVVDSLRPEDQERLPRYPVPAVLMTRLAVASSMAGQGLGAALVLLAAEKAIQASEAVAAKLFVVDALDQRAAAYYKRFDFSPCPDDPLRLYIGIKRLVHRLKP